MARTPKQKDLLIETLTTVEAIGINATIDRLKSLRGEDVEFQSAEVDFVIKMISENFKILFQDVITLRLASNQHRNALLCAIYYLHNKFFGFDISYRKVSKIVNRDKGQCVRYHKEVIAYRENEQENKVFQRYFKKFDALVHEYKKINKVPIIPEPKKEAHTPIKTDI